MSSEQGQNPNKYLLYTHQGQVRKQGNSNPKPPYDLPSGARHKHHDKANEIE